MTFRSRLFRDGVFRLWMTFNALILVAFLISACNDQSAGLGGINSVEIEGYDVVCFVAANAIGEVKSIDCLPGKTDLKEGN